MLRSSFPWFKDTAYYSDIKCSIFFFPRFYSNLGVHFSTSINATSSLLGYVLRTWCYLLTCFWSDRPQGIFSVTLCSFSARARELYFFLCFLFFFLVLFLQCWWQMQHEFNWDCLLGESVPKNYQNHARTSACTTNRSGRQFYLCIRAYSWSKEIDESIINIQNWISLIVISSESR
jgi:hypothetical protein